MELDLTRFFKCEIHNVPFEDQYIAFGCYQRVCPKCQSEKWEVLKELQKENDKE